jgi:hypothetical protein
MIITTTTTGNTMFNRRYTCSTDAATIKIPAAEEVKDFCLCKYETEACYRVFYDPTDEANEYKNDYYKVFTPLLSANSTVTYKLIDGSDVEYNIEDYATIYAKGFNTVQPNMEGFLLNWFNVGTDPILGPGKYKIKTTIVEFNITREITTDYFELVPFDTLRANGTVKIEVELDGLTMNGFDYSGLNLTKVMTRLNGRLGVPKTIKESENGRIITSERKRVDIQTTLYNEYNLVLNELNGQFIEELIENNTSLIWYVTDYNVKNKKNYVKLPLLVEDIEPLDDYLDYSKQSFELTLTNQKVKLNRKFVN